MEFLRRTALLGLSLVALAGCAEDPDNWIAGHGHDHPLAGRIYDVAAKRMIAPAELYARLAEAEFVLLGEKHDNPDHHRLQARVIDRLNRKHAAMLVAFEMIDDSQAPALAAHLAARPNDVDGIRQAVDWDDSGWPHWSLYRPVFAAALAGGGTLIGANFARQEARRIAKDGTEAAFPDLVPRFALDRPLPADQAEALATVLRESHCNQMPEHMVAPMTRVQRARDALMATRLLDRAEDSGVAVLIAGGGHTRGDWGVPAYLRRERPDAKIVNLAFAEVDGEFVEPGDYRLAYDYLWFTPRRDEEDPCVKFKKQLQQFRKKKAS